MAKIVVGLVALLGLGFLITPPASAQGTAFSKVEQGRYLVKAGDCASCHTDDGGQPFAGGRPLPTPFGTIYSTNITPDVHTGIGAWSEQDFYDALHEGIRRDGEYLYPVFPYPWFTKLTPSDVSAIKAYLDTLAPITQKNKPAKVPWPLSWRESMLGWNALYFRAGTFRPRSDKSAQWNRGAYLVEGPGHCELCHTSKNMLGAVDRDNPFRGGSAGDYWYAPSLSENMRHGIGTWSVAEIVEYLKTGSNAKTASAGPMTEVVTNSTRYLTDADLRAIAIYLKDIPQGDDGDVGGGKLSAQALARGQALFVDNCTACHMEDGGGQANVFPPLKNSAAIQERNPDTVIHIVLAGARMAATPGKPTGLAMPAFGWKLSDREVADVVNYIRHAWGNRAPLVDAEAVADGRAKVKEAAAR